MNRNLALWIIIGLFLVAIFNLFQAPPSHKQHTAIAYSNLLRDAKEGHVKKAHIRGNVVSGELADGSSYTSTIPPHNTTLADRLTDLGVFVDVENIEDEMPSFFQILLGWLPMILLIGVWIFFMRQMQSGGSKAMGFGKSKARLLTERHGRVTFDDVAGID